MKKKKIIKMTDAQHEELYNEFGIYDPHAYLNSLILFEAAVKKANEFLYDVAWSMVEDCED